MEDTTRRGVGRVQVETERVPSERVETSWTEMEKMTAQIKRRSKRKKAQAGER